MSDKRSELALNKIFAGVLCGALLIMVGVKTSDFLMPPAELAEHAYPIDVPEADSGASVPAPAAPQAAEPILALLAEADIVRGEKVAKKCTACHSFSEVGAAKVGPNLYNIINAAKGRDGGFAYSAALSELGGVWDYSDLNGFLHKPRAWLKGTNMNFVGLKKAQDRADLVAWLRTLSATPAPLPTVSPPTRATDEGENDEDENADDADDAESDS